MLFISTIGFLLPTILSSKSLTLAFKVCLWVSLPWVLVASASAVSSINSKLPKAYFLPYDDADPNFWGICIPFWSKSTPTSAVANISSLDSLSIMEAVVCIIGKSPNVKFSFTIKCTSYLLLKGFNASNISSADLKLYLPKLLNLDFLALNSNCILLNFSVNFI